MQPALVVAFSVGALAGVAGLALGDSHRTPVRDAIDCQFDFDCAAAVEGTGAPPICVTNVPGQDPYCATAIAPPPNRDVATALAVGRPSLAADISWMQVIQYIGAPHSESVKHAGLENWILLINELDPRFRQPYFHGAILLSLAPDRAEVAERILLQGREVFADDPRQWEWNMWLGFVQYFGLLRPDKAADSYQRSYDSGGPKYLEAFASDLRNAREGCADLWLRLNEARAQSAGSQEGSLLSASVSRDALVHCFEVYLSAAVTKYKVQLGREPASIDELREMGLLAEEVPEIPGMCWKIEHLKARLRSCGSDGAK